MVDKNKAAEAELSSALDRPSVEWAKGTEPNSTNAHHARKVTNWIGTLSLAYASLGVVYGDIGTSPLYTFSSIFATVDAIDADDVKMGFSLIFWSLTLVVLLKYVLIVMRADDNGEGGTFALYTQLCRSLGTSVFGTLQAPERSQLRHLSRRSTLNRVSQDGSKKVVFEDPTENPTTRWWNKGAIPAQPIRMFFQQSTTLQRTLLFLAIVATAMVLGDGVLTPVVSVVAAVSGLQQGVDNISNDFIIGVTCAILIILFSVQFNGTRSIAFTFSPIVILWLGSNAAIGIWSLSKFDASVAQGFSPHWIVKFFKKFGADGWAMLGSVMLAVTGCEAMFADMGHFNYHAVGFSWVFYAYPCLVLTYLGQGAYLMKYPENISTVYWSTVPHSVFWPMLVLATAASVVASQALISACFSICKQAKALGFFPKLKIVHTSKDQGGQVYVASANWILMVLTVAIVAGFKADSVRLGQAYGLSISAVMLITTLFITLIMIFEWQLSAVFVVAFFCVFGLIDGAFLSANFTKVAEGAWVALAIAGGFGGFMVIWWLGQRRRLSALAEVSKTQGGRLFTWVKSTDKGPARKRSQPLPATNMGRDSLDTDAGDVKTAAGGKTGNAVDLGLLRGELKLALTSSPDRPMVILPGIGIFHSENANTVPSVLYHFLRNIEAVHQINIFLCARFLPVPTIAPEDRLLVRAVPQLPTFYSAIVRYGYMDIVDHGEAFINSLLSALAQVLCGTDAWSEDVIEALRRDASTGPIAEGAMDVTSPSEAYVSPFALAPPSVQQAFHGPPSHTIQLSEISIEPSNRPLNAVSLQIPNAPPRLSVNIATLSRSIETSYLGQELTRRAMTDGKASTALDRLYAIVQDESCTAEVEASLRILGLIEAARNGVVYYFGRTTLKMKSERNILSNILYDQLYRPMLLLSYAENEAWKVPSNNCIDLGMTLFI